jgi:hypothetical protein
MAYPTRRSKRIKTQRVKYNENDEDDGPESRTVNNDDSDTTTKSRATGPSGPPQVGSRKKKGLLAQLTEFPLDVLLEVCAFLSPICGFDGLTMMADFQGTGSP